MVYLLIYDHTTMEYPETSEFYKTYESYKFRFSDTKNIPEIKEIPIGKYRIDSEIPENLMREISRRVNLGVPAFWKFPKVRTIIEDSCKKNNVVCKYLKK